MTSVNTGWIIGAAILVLLVGLSSFYTGRGPHPSAPNTVTQQK